MTIIDPALWGTSRDELKDALKQIGIARGIIAIGWGEFKKMQFTFNDRPLMQNHMQLYNHKRFSNPGLFF